MLPSGAPSDKVLAPEAAFACLSGRAMAAVGASVPCREAPDLVGWRALDTLAEPGSFAREGRCCHHLAAGGAIAENVIAIDGKIADLDAHPVAQTPGSLGRGGALTRSRRRASRRADRRRARYRRADC